MAKKAAHVAPDERSDAGDQWVWVALAMDSRLALSFLVDRRSDEAAHNVLRDVRARVVGHPLISTDGLAAYPDAVASAFGWEAVYGVMTCEDRPGDDPGVPGQRVKVRRVLMGTPDPAQITTAHVERSNLTLRMGSRRFTRKSNGYSKRLRHLRAAVALHYFHYNFCRVHETIGTTPAVAAGLTDDAWSIAGLVASILGRADESFRGLQDVPGHRVVASAEVDKLVVDR